MDRLLGIELDYELLVNRHGDLFPGRITSEMSLEFGSFQFQPGGCALSFRRYHCFLDPDRIPAFLPDLDLVSGFHEERRDVDLSAIDLNVAMPYKLAGIGPGTGKAKPEHSIVQSPLQQDDQVLTRNTLLAISHLEIVPELSLHDAIDPPGFLFFSELYAIVGMLDPPGSMLSGGIGSALDCTFIGITPVSLEEKFGAFPPAEPTD